MILAVQVNVPVNKQPEKLAGYCRDRLEMLNQCARADPVMKFIGQGLVHVDDGVPVTNARIGVEGFEVFAIRDLAIGQSVDECLAWANHQGVAVMIGADFSPG